MQHRNRLFVGAAAGILLALAAVVSVLGYTGQVVATVTVSGPGSNVSCGTSTTIIAYVQDVNGNPVDGRAVSWSFLSGNIPGDKFSVASSITDSTGHASVKVTFACPGTATIASTRVVHIQALSDTIAGPITVTVTTHGLPGTSTDPASSTPLVADALAGFGVLFGSWIILRRVAAARG